MGHVQFEPAYEEVLRAIGRLGHTVTTVTAPNGSARRIRRRPNARLPSGRLNPSRRHNSSRRPISARRQMSAVRPLHRAGQVQPRGDTQATRRPSGPWVLHKIKRGFSRKPCASRVGHAFVDWAAVPPRAGMSDQRGASARSAPSDRAAGPARRPDPRADRMARTVGAVRATTTRSHRAAKMSPRDGRTLTAVNDVVNHTVECGD